MILQNYKKVTDCLDKVKGNKDGIKPKTNMEHGKKLCPRSKDPPTAMVDS